MTTSIKPKIIHAHSPLICAIPAFLVSKIHHLPFVYEIRAFWEDAAVASRKYKENSIRYKTVRTFETFICKRVNKVVTLSKGMKKDLIKRGVQPEKINIIPNGVDLTRFNNLTNNDELISQFKLKGKIIFGYIGSFFDFEGIEDLIDAITQLKKEKDKIKLLLVGGGERESDIRKLLNDKKIENIILIGQVSHNEVVQYYSLMDVLVYPRKSSRITELTTPLKPLEAMAQGKAIICSSVGGLKELVGSDNGLFFAPGNVDQLVACCRKLIVDPALRVNLGMRGKFFVESKKQWLDIIKLYESIYQSLC